MDKPGAGRFLLDRRPVVKAIPAAYFVRHGRAVAEMRWDRVSPELLTPADRFFVRNQGRTPLIDVAKWRLRIVGPAVGSPLTIDYDELLRMPAVTITRALECAGNGRRFFGRQHSVVPPGAPWGLGGIGVAEWTGVPLADVLRRARISPDAVDVMPIGVDKSAVRRPMPIAKALEEDTLLAYALNGEPLPPDHGFPLRVLVPGWAGIASIKWVGGIRVSNRPLRTKWNTEVYVLRGDAHRESNDSRSSPVSVMPVKSALELPWPATIQPGSLTISGRSWSGAGAIAKVEVSTDGGRRWFRARLLPPNIPRAWTRWQFDWVAPHGKHAIRAKATDDHGNVQPDRASWNDLGYLYDAVVPHPVRVVGGA